MSDCGCDACQKVEELADQVQAVEELIGEAEDLQAHLLKTLKEKNLDKLARRGRDVQLSLVFHNLRTEWYTERALDPFSIFVERGEVDNLDEGQESDKEEEEGIEEEEGMEEEEGGEEEEEANDRRRKREVNVGGVLALRLLDGRGNDASHLLALHHSKTKFSEAEPFTAPLELGKCEIRGLKFLSISAKYGDFFQLQATVLSEKGGARLPGVREGYSLPIAVRSCRLYSTQKNPSDLRPSDSVMKLPNIGRVYGLALQNEGVVSIQDLATECFQNKHKRAALIRKVRKSKGRLNEEEFFECVKVAQCVVDGVWKKKRGRRR